MKEAQTLYGLYERNPELVVGRLYRDYENPEVILKCEGISPVRGGRVTLFFSKLGLFQRKRSVNVFRQALDNFLLLTKENLDKREQNLFGEGVKAYNWLFGTLGELPNQKPYKAFSHS